MSRTYNEFKETESQMCKRIAENFIRNLEIEEKTEFCLADILSKHDKSFGVHLRQAIENQGFFTYERDGNCYMSRHQPKIIEKYPWWKSWRAFWSPPTTTPRYILGIFYFFSISIAIRTFISAAYSSGSSRTTGERNPFTIIVFAASSPIPRLFI